MSDESDTLQDIKKRRPNWGKNEWADFAALQTDEVKKQADTIEQLREELENERAQGIHSCGPNCQRLACVQRREIERLQARCEKLEATLHACGCSLLTDSI